MDEEKRKYLDAAERLLGAMFAVAKLCNGFGEFLNLISTYAIPVWGLRETKTEEAFTKKVRRYIK